MLKVSQPTDLKPWMIDSNTFRIIYGIIKQLQGKLSDITTV